ncbi:MAG: Rrf2 family transcriptional regulator [bacterium]|nr:Rrf2 family transcriptional regulator [bacterium]
MHRNFKISSRSHHGVVFIAELGRVCDGAPVSIREIAGRLELPEKYLEELVRALRAAGLVVSSRGRTGGYRLARQPREITMGEVVRALEGPIVLAHCLDAQTDDACPHEQSCVSRSFFQRLQQTIEQELDHMTLADIATAHAKTASP